MVEQVEMPASSLSVLDPRDAQRKRTEPTPSGCSLTLTQYGMQIPPKEKRQKSCFLWSKTRPSLEESARSKALREWNWPCQSLLRGWPGFLVHFSPQSPGPKTFLSYCQSVSSVRRGHNCPACASRTSRWMTTPFPSCQATAGNHCMAKMGHSWTWAVTITTKEDFLCTLGAPSCVSTTPCKEPSCRRGSGRATQRGAGRLFYLHFSNYLF